MAEFEADPSTLQDALRRLRAGDALTLRPGCYRAPVVASDLKGTAQRPIVIRGAGGVAFDGGRSAEDYREEANRRAASVQAGGRYPGLWPYLDEAMIRLVRCEHVSLERISIRRAWPTAIWIYDCRDVRLASLDIADSTFAVGAGGGKCRGLLIEDVDWVQDVTRDRLWRRVLWTAVHGEQRVDVANDWRLYDGDFFRSEDIAGAVTIRRCTVQHAFNAVHGFNECDRPELSRDFAIHDCRFAFVRDNVFEPEDCALNWWFYRNRIYNCHKWFSIETSRSGFVYLFSNLGWFDEIQGPPDDGYRAGGVFKLAKAQRPIPGEHYVFNNSFALRSDYIRNGTLRGLRHWANAIRYCAAGEGACDARARFFGDLAAAPGDVERRFATNWRGEGIEFGDDVARHPEYRAALEAAGYGPFAGGRVADPSFVDPIAPGPDGDGLRCAPGSPCLGRAAPRRIVLPDGSVDVLPEGRDIRAFQRDALFRWREFMPLDTAVA